MTLTSDQIKQIKLYVLENNVTILSLRDDLVDHICCEVELRMSDGKDFSNAMNEALMEFTPADLYEIEQQTEFLLHPNKVIMKKLTYFVGLASAISMSMGLMLKILHMPGGEQLINYGFFAFAGFFLPAITFWKLNEGKQLSTVDKLKIGVGILSTVGLVISIVAKIRMDLNFSTIVLFCTTTLFSFGFLPLHFYQMYQRSLSRSN
ncbi:MAG TPA: hypothetical protein VGD40_24055 [Chryseosolibacter sp.]